MNRDEARSETSTRREYLAAGSAVIAGGLLAGCSSEGDAATDPSTDTSTGTGTANPNSASAATDTPDGTEGPDGTTTRAAESYTVSIEPVGEVTFESVPETWVANNGSWADMGVALGLEPPKGLWLTNRYHTQYYDDIPDVSVSKADTVSLYQDGVSKELFYDLDGDVHVMDPNFLMNRFKGWERADVEEIEENIAPVFGNCIYAQHYPWHEDYRYYTLYEGFEKLADVFQRQDRYRAFEAVHEEFESNLAPVVPGTADRPEVAVLWGVGSEPETYYPYIVGDGTSFKHLRQLGVRDALAGSDIKDFHGSRAAIDLETLLKVDPPILMLRGYESMSPAAFRDSVVSFLENHNTASALTAVQNGDVYRAGGLYQGPITYMVLTERTAGQLYDFDGELFDRSRVADIVNGNL